MRPGADCDDKLHLFKQAVRDSSVGCTDVALTLSHAISDDPELGFVEHRAAQRTGELLENHGYEVRRGVAGLETALLATAGDGDLVVGLCAEYDALPGIGHACGHNVITGAAVLAALALRPHLEDLGVSLRVYGTPAEEGGGGKVVMLEAGAFDGLDAVMMVHPTPHDLVVPAILAMVTLRVEFHGFTPPSMSPELGRSAADAVTLTQVAVGLLRQHLRITDRISGYIAAEGSSPNVLPAHAALTYCLRGATGADLADVERRFRTCVNGAALSTATEVSVTQVGPRYEALRHDESIGRLYEANAVALGRQFRPVGNDNLVRSASTDFGNVSQRIPAIHPLIGVEAHGTSNHQAGFAVHCRGASGDAAVLDAGLALAWTVVDIACSAQARAALRSQRDAP